MDYRQRHDQYLPGESSGVPFLDRHQWLWPFAVLGFFCALGLMALGLGVVLGKFGMGDG